MWKFSNEPNLVDIRDRLTALETGPISPQDYQDLKDTLALAEEKIVDLGATQEAAAAQVSSLKPLEDKIKDLTFAVAEGIERVERYERRIKATIKRARKEFAERGFESPGLEAEAHELREIGANGEQGTDEGAVLPLNAAAGQAEWVQPMRMGLAPNSKAHAIRAKWST